MPLYDYLCHSCQHTFDKFSSIADRNIPCEEPCPKCNEFNVQQMIGAPPMGDSVRLGITRPDNGFREVLSKIHEKTPGSTLNKHSRYF